jgi:hypothetical protein
LDTLKEDVSHSTAIDRLVEAANAVEAGDK